MLPELYVRIYDCSNLCCVFDSLTFPYTCVSTDPIILLHSVWFTE